LSPLKKARYFPKKPFFLFPRLPHRMIVLSPSPGKAPFGALTRPFGGRGLVAGVLRLGALDKGHRVGFEARGGSEPVGVVSSFSSIRPPTGLATPSCLETYAVAFIEGTEPKDTCDQPLPPNGLVSASNGPLPGEGEKDDHSVGKAGEQKKGFFGKVAGFFKGDKSPPPAPAKPKGDGQPPQ